MKMTIISPAFAAESEPETHESVGAAGGEAHHEGGFPPFQQENFAPQIVWLIGIFAILYLLMSRVALPRVGGILEHRESKIASDLEASREMQAKAQAAARANEESIRLRREEAQAIGRDAQQKIASDAAAQRTRAEAEAAEKIRAAEARINAAKSQALGNVEQIAVDAAASIIEKLSGVSVDRDRLVAEHRSVKSS
jgi:F-type H+-transporting ATPase subunit b